MCRESTKSPKECSHKNPYWVNDVKISKENWRYRFSNENLRMRNSSRFRFFYANQFHHYVRATRGRILGKYARKINFPLAVWLHKLMFIQSPAVTSRASWKFNQNSICTMLSIDAASMTLHGVNIRKVFMSSDKFKDACLTAVELCLAASAVERKQEKQNSMLRVHKLLTFSVATNSLRFDKF